MRILKQWMVWVMVFSTLVLTVPAAAAVNNQPLSKDEIKYLEDLARDTWACIDYFRDPVTGFPLDNNYRPGWTNTTNLALYMVSVVAAEKMGYLDTDEAKARVNKLLQSLMDYQDWNGLLNNKIDVTGKETAVQAGFNAFSDFNKLPAALMIIRQAYPDIELASELFERVQWDTLWDQQQNQLMQGFDVKNHKTVSWGAGWLASDVRLGVMIGIGAGGFPVLAYDRMERNTIEQYGLTFFRPNWEFAGLFMHAMDGVFMDDRNSELGISAANFAMAQMLFAQEHGYPAWGWSACNLPGNDGYTVDGHLMQSVVTPHASALMIGYYPKKVVANLKALENLGGRKPYEENGKTYNFGFRDSVDMSTGEVSDLYLSSLDQTMLFISVVNYLRDGFIWEKFKQDPVYVKAVKLLAKYYTNDKRQLAVYAQRDADPLPTANLRAAQPAAAQLIDDGENADGNSLDQPRQIKVEAADYRSLVYQVVPGGKTGKALQLTFNFENAPNGRGRFVENLVDFDAKKWNAIRFDCRAQTSNLQAVQLRVRVNDSMGSVNTMMIDDLGPEWEDVVIPLERFRGIVADLSHVQSVEFSLEKAPGFMPERKLIPNQGTVWLDNIQFVNVPKAQIKELVQNAKKRNALVFNVKGPVSGFAEMKGWKTFSDTSATFTLSRINKPQPALQVKYNLGSGGKWVGWDKDCAADLSKNFKITYEYCGSGSKNKIEMKLFSPSGAVFGKRVAYGDTAGKWKKVVLLRKDIERMWGGQDSDKLGMINQFGFTVAGDPKTQGTLAIRNLEFEKLQ